MASEESTYTPRHRRTKRKRRLVLVAGILFILLLVTYGAVLSKDILTAKRFLNQAREDLDTATGMANDGKLVKSWVYFKKAEGHLLEARESLYRPSVKVAAVIPVASQNINALTSMISAGVEVSRTGQLLSTALMQVPSKDGWPDVGPVNGKVDLSPLTAARPFVRRADDHAQMAIAAYKKIKPGLLLPPVRDAKEELGGNLKRLTEITATARNILGILPNTFGGDRERRYFLAIQNNAELRATGGLIGNYSIITIANGKAFLEDFNDISVLQRKDLPVDAPQDFTDRYGRFKATSKWPNANMSPDFPTVGRVLLNLYKSNTGEDLDGVISIDPVGLGYLLEAIGPISVPKIDEKIDAGNVVNWTLAKAYSKYENREDRKDFLEYIARAVWEQVVSGQGNNEQKLTTQFLSALNDKHIMLFSAHKEEQKVFEDLGYAGALTPTTCDFLQVLVQNQGANKLDFYMHEKVGYAISLNADGSARSTLTIKITNNAPKAGLSPYVAGASPGGARDGFSNAYLSAYVPKGARLVDAVVNNRRDNPEVDHEKDKTIFSNNLHIAPGASKTIVFVYDLPKALILNGNKSEYTLDWQAQPIVNHADITLDVEIPESLDVAKLPAGMSKQGREVTLKKKLIRDERFTIGLSGN